MMKRLSLIFIFLYAFSFANAQNAIPPRWIHGQVLIGEKCDFIIIHSEGESNIRDARTAALADLRSKVLHTDIVTVNQSYSDKSHDVYSLKDNAVSISSQQEDEGWMQIKIEGLPTNVTSRRIDEFSRKKGSGIEYFALVAIPEPNSHIDLSRLTTTTSYASDPATWGLSLIPGAAQMHKGSYLKGGIIMGGTVALAGGLVAFESMRASYLAKISQTHSAEVKKEYNNRAGNCATMRNICIGGLAALYVYNILDAFIAPGARRVIVTPAATPDGQYGMAVSYRF